MSSGLESEELRVRQSLLYTVGRICDEEAQKQQREPHARPRPAMSKEAMALLADVVYKQAEVMATELQFFARHANRKAIKTEDVVLCARKHPNLVAVKTSLLQKYQHENLSASSTTSGGKKRRRHFADSD